jgi:hypothetical protein
MKTARFFPGNNLVCSRIIISSLLLSVFTCSTILCANPFPAEFELSSLDGTNGFQINGIDREDYSGYFLSGAGDVNNDGINDVLIGATWADPGGKPNAGESYVVFGMTSVFPAQFNLSALNGTNGFQLNGINGGDESGYALCAAGDVNGDGIDDIIIGAPYAGPGGKSNAGQAYVVFGSANGFPAQMELSALNGSNGFTLNGISSEDYCGQFVSGEGDVNDDGFNDILINAPWGDPGGRNNAGETYVVFGSSNVFPAVFDLTGLTGTNGFQINGRSVDDEAGYPCSIAGDVNNDGIDDILLGAWMALQEAGETYVIYGRSDGFPAEMEVALLDGILGFQINGISAGDASGYPVNGAGDVNDDGIDDMIIGATWADPGGRSKAGETYVVYGRTNFTALFQLSSLNGSNGFQLNGIDADDESGYSVAGAGDIDNDGISDIIIGAPYAMPTSGKVAAGETYIVYGRSDGFPAVMELATLGGTNGFRFNGIDTGDTSGDPSCGAGDVNGDGVDDIIIGAWQADPGGLGAAGETYVVYGIPEPGMVVLVLLGWMAMGRRGSVSA